MSRPRFLADHDLNEHIITGVRRRHEGVEFLRARVGPTGRPRRPPEGGAATSTGAPAR